MRRFLSLALMLLLVLRGLMGTAMAAGMVPALPATSPTVHVGHALAQSAAPTVPAHAVLHAGASDPRDSTAQAACHGCDVLAHSPACSVCDICHSALLAPPTLAAPPTHASSEVHPTATAPFASAQAALAVKPPIL
ncbi:hypothetical protein B2J86_15580 [Acidovorax sp. SRB_14]|uniref:hypothetical protein n=1 Tax=Acidovorax sp. SRB_14 TaxID=1962699 RepID=UPI00146DE259|nr:hypothetical protein [Acidovorax sp. SRB_14]NMM82332.1 hypothetical protein [Acidovorax sp. SRB_14]NMM90334.1 hypothetical protein [Rhodococcus sp. SRB_17]